MHIARCARVQCTHIALHVALAFRTSSHVVDATRCPASACQQDVRFDRRSVPDAALHANGSVSLPPIRHQAGSIHDDTKTRDLRRAGSRQFSGQTDPGSSPCCRHAPFPAASWVRGKAKASPEAPPETRHAAPFTLVSAAGSLDCPLVDS